MNDDLLQEGFALALHESARAWRHALDRRLKSLGLSQASWMSIAFLARAKTPLTPERTRTSPLGGRADGGGHGGPLATRGIGTPRDRPGRPACPAGIADP